MCKKNECLNKILKISDNESIIVDSFEYNNHIYKLGDRVRCNDSVSQIIGVITGIDFKNNCFNVYAECYTDILSTSDGDYKVHSMDLEGSKAIDDLEYLGKSKLIAGIDTDDMIIKIYKDKALAKADRDHMSKCKYTEKIVIETDNNTQIGYGLL